jgi:hypothetical protein
MQAVRANLYALMLTDDDAENQALLADIRRRSELNNRNLENYGNVDVKGHPFPRSKGTPTFPQ